MSQDSKSDHSSPQSPNKKATGFSRRDLLHWSGVTGLSAMAATVLPGKAVASAVLSPDNATAPTTGTSVAVEENEPVSAPVQKSP